MPVNIKMCLKSHLMAKTTLIVFLKIPEKGKVKTRLSKALDEDFVLELYKAFVSDLVEKLKPVHHKLFFVWPPAKDSADPFEKNAALIEKGKYFAEKINELEKLIMPDMPFYSQQGDHLGEKMANAFESVFDEGYERAVLIGTDIPEISCDIILKAFDLLESQKAVIGPSADSGYYLIGFSKSGFSKSVFDHIEWSSPKVLSQTLARMKSQGISLSFLPVLDDIDTIEDLRALALRCEKGNEIGPRTRKMLEQL